MRERGGGRRQWRNADDPIKRLSQRLCPLCLHSCAAVPYRPVPISAWLFIASRIAV